MNIRYIIHSINGFFNRIDLRDVLSNTSDLTGLLPIIGYALVTMSFIDFIYTVVPLQLQNPEWELNTISALTEHSWVFLIGLGFIFARYFSDNQYDVRFLEIVYLRFIRWVILIMGIVFFIIIPLVFVDTQRIIKSVNDQITQQKNSGIEQITQIEKRLAAGTNAEQLQLFAKNINLSPEELNLPVPQLKNAITKNLTIAKNRISEGATQNQQQQRKRRWKNSLRTVIALVIISFTCVVVWFKIGQACL